ncbi:hypothetical protein Hamer_G005141, partial [Homarus americanus]
MDHHSKKVQSLSVFWNTEEKDEEVARMLGSLPGLDWRKPVFFSISPKTISSKYSIPEGFYLDTLRPKDTPTVMSSWKYRWTESQTGLETLLQSVPSVALRKRGDSDPASEDQLVGWCYLYNNGMLGNKFIVPEYRGQGLSSFALRLIPKIYRDGLLPYFAFSTSYNRDGVKFEELGFVKGMDMEAVFYLPKGKTVEG